MLSKNGICPKCQRFIQCCAGITALRVVDPTGKAPSMDEPGSREIGRCDCGIIWSRYKGNEQWKEGKDEL